MQSSSPYWHAYVLPYNCAYMHVPVKHHYIQGANICTYTLTSQHSMPTMACQSHLLTNGPTICKEATGGCPHTCKAQDNRTYN